MMRKFRVALTGGLLCLAVIPSLAAAGASAILVPARRTMVQFAFDVARLRSVALVSYELTGDIQAPHMHRWSQQRKAWIPTFLSEVRSGAAFAGRPARVFIIGLDPEQTAVLQDAVRWAGSVVVLPAFQVAPLINTLNRDLEFAPGELRWLAQRHGLEIEDRTPESVRYGRYGPPGRPPVTGSPLEARWPWEQRGRPVAVPQTEQAPAPPGRRELDVIDPNALQPAEAPFELPTTTDEPPDFNVPVPQEKGGHDGGAAIRTVVPDPVAPEDK